METNVANNDGSKLKRKQWASSRYVSFAIS